MGNTAKEFQSWGASSCSHIFFSCSWNVSPISEDFPWTEIEMGITHSIPIFGSSLVHLLALHKAQWHLFIEDAKHALIFFSVPQAPTRQKTCPAQTSWGLIWIPEELREHQCSTDKEAASTLHPVQEAPSSCPSERKCSHWLQAGRRATSDASPPRSCLQETWTYQKFTLVPSLRLLQWWGPTAHRCRRPRRRAGPGRWVPRCGTLHRPRARCAARPGLRCALEKTENLAGHRIHLRDTQTSGLGKSGRKAIQMGAPIPSLVLKHSLQEESTRFYWTHVTVELFWKPGLQIIGERQVRVPKQNAGLHTDRLTDTWKPIMLFSNNQTSQIWGFFTEFWHGDQPGPRSWQTL